MFAPEQKRAYLRRHKGAFFLDMEEVGALQDYLLELGWLENAEVLHYMERAGEGNMNLTLRVTSNQRSFIIKQARSWVEKYPQIDAPEERVLMEGLFYQIVQKDGALRSFVPDILGLDTHSYIMALEDLGHASDYTFVYEREKELKPEDLNALTNFLSLLHEKFNRKCTAEFLENRAMRELNHEHLFIFPLLESNGFDLDTIQPGLQQLAMSYKTDVTYKDKVLELGDIYLTDGEYLLHGDFYPGSWLKTSDGPKVIDPEFGFFGPAEFDLAVFVAHLKMALQPDAIVNHVISSYQRNNDFDEALFQSFVGIELMRRLIGIAQLPLSLTVQEKAILLEEARHLIMQET